MVNTALAQAGIGYGQSLNVDAAVAWSALVAQVKADTGHTIVATEGTRTYARQKQLYEGWRKGLAGFNPAWSPDSPYAYHLSGRAVDVGSSVGYVATESSRAFYSRAGQYGFRPTVQGEPWHFEFRPEWVGVSLEVAAVEKKVIPIVQEDTMTVIVNVGRDYWVADLGAKTKWNASAGSSNTAEAMNRLRVFRDMGVRQFDNQAPYVLAGFTDITSR
jgi:hypothetical protein